MQEANIYCFYDKRNGRQWTRGMYSSAVFLLHVSASKNVEERGCRCTVYESHTTIVHDRQDFWIRQYNMNYSWWKRLQCHYGCRNKIKYYGGRKVVWGVGFEIVDRNCAGCIIKPGCTILYGKLEGPLHWLHGSRCYNNHFVEANRNEVENWSWI